MGKHNETCIKKGGEDSVNLNWLWTFDYELF